ncbi:hypothetical protein acsn021_33390 [Anaerocolumna cellulosilytica]|uniref:Uncharacterized protein n=1 Tax=Anaerocolumna cellulosilytica TaxID=433286 RepID=A0A6S6R8L0_9FIRM|nr:DUF6320 domain-containing protein [Anaerocolumna cellulosilytica]MBB5196837.1 hypothetical protein [Anaerocolumna cellulosilytica]BCJ95770.1 hypothetical protein acsn021_33390 [Anaerocolumna cellulosilytica]
MQFCEHCKVHIRGNRKYCPLCQNVLTGEGREEEEIVPAIPTSYQYNLILRVMVFLSICIIVLSFAVNALFPVQVNWPMFIIAGILCVWISLAMVIRKRHNVPKSIIWQVAVISILAVIWDWRTGWIGWSLDYVFPIACVVAMIVMYISAKVLHLGVRDFIIYILLDGIFGILPVIFLLCNLLQVKYPSVISVSCSILSLAAVLLFEWENIWEELKKRLHM